MRIVILVALATLVASSLCSAQEPRERIALRGTICKGAVGIPKWAADRSVNNYGELGDLILLRTDAKPKERVTVGIYLQYRSVIQQGDDWVETSEWKWAPASSRGREWGYVSTSLQSVGAWTRFSNGSTENADRNIQLFLPYDAIGLPGGTYRFRYRVRVWSGETIVDDFDTDEDRIARIAATDQYRELIAICASPDGPSTCDFRLLGTDDEEAVPVQGR